MAQGDKLRGRTHAIPALFKHALIPTLDTNLHEYLDDELYRVEVAINSVADLVPQVSDYAPSSPRIGMIRYAIDPWDPLGTGQPAWVYYDGTAWVALP